MESRKLQMRKIGFHKVVSYDGRVSQCNSKVNHVGFQLISCNAIKYQNSNEAMKNLCLNQSVSYSIEKTSWKLLFLITIDC